jgi:hypothetical protein
MKPAEAIENSILDGFIINPIHFTGNKLLTPRIVIDIYLFSK